MLTKNQKTCKMMFIAPKWKPQMPINRGINKLVKYTKWNSAIRINKLKLPAMTWLHFTNVIWAKEGRQKEF